MESHILKHAQERAPEFRPNDRLDQLIEQLQRFLAPIQETVNCSFHCPPKPVVVVVGCPRSGTTFMTQLLVATGAFAYPTNILSRFAYAPHLGALIQQLLLNPEYDLGNEFSDLRSTSGFASNVGKTAGALGINEFFHFWRRFFPNHDPGFLAKPDLEKVEIHRLRAEIASIQAVFEKPFMSKAMMLQYNLDYFAKHMPELKIIHVTREPIYVMQSISQARLKYYGTDKIWWSVKPREYEYLKDKDPLTQVAGQVFFTDQEITKQTADLPRDRFVTAQYESVCNDPKAFISGLAERFTLPELLEGVDRIQDHYTSGNSKRLDRATLTTLEQRYMALQHADGTTGFNL